MQHQQQANGLGGSKQGEAAALIALAGAAGLPDGPAGYPFKPEGSNGSDQTGQCHLPLCGLSSEAHHACHLQ